MEILIFDDFRLYGTESKLEEFYSLLVKESLGREDVNTMETENLKSVFFLLTLLSPGGGKFAPTLTYLRIRMCVCVYTCQFFLTFRLF